MPQDLLSRLRIETRIQHEQLEARLDLPARLREPDDYVALLLKFRGIYLPLEASLQTCSNTGSFPFDWEPRRKLPLLDTDLEALGVAADQRNSAPVYANAPRPTTVAEALGCAYVLEGSTLGGQIIVREVIGARDALQPIHAAGATRFFSSYGPQVGRYWRDFCSALNAWGQDATEDEGAGCVSFSAATFTAFDHWLTAENSRAEESGA